MARSGMHVRLGAGSGCHPSARYPDSNTAPVLAAEQIEEGRDCADESEDDQDESAFPDTSEVKVSVLPAGV